MRKLFALLTVVLFASFMMAQNNTATVTQSGWNNHGDVTQTTDNNAIISTTGDYNKDIVIQNLDNDATITQVGNGNGNADPTIASITQVSYNEACITQNGFREYATIYQQNENHSSIQQSGSWNSASQYMGGSNGFSKTEQNGIQNNSTIKTLHNHNGQFEFDQPLSVKQIGDRNIGNITTGWATSSDDNWATISQTGNDNKGYVEQEGGDSNIGRIFTTGSRNNDHVSQSGMMNLGQMYQTGSDNIGTISQNGDSNGAMLIQSSSDNSGIITQTGNFNYSNVNQ